MQLRSIAGPARPRGLVADSSLGDVNGSLSQRPSAMTSSWVDTTLSDLTHARRMYELLTLALKRGLSTMQLRRR